MFRLFGAKPPAENKELGMVVKPIVFNPGSDETTRYAIYRSDAIARDIEQRREEGRERNRDHDKMVGEAMSYAYHLVGKAVWTHEQADALKARLMAK